MRALKNLLWMAILLLPMILIAQVVAPSGEVPVVPPVPDVPVMDIFKEIMKALGDWKALGWQAGLAGLLTALLSTTKSSMLRAWIWDRIPVWAKALVAPVVGILIFALAMKEFSIAVLIAGLTTGAAAVFLHQLLDGLKAVPWIGDKWKQVIDFLSAMMRKPPPPV